jgi:hypothetical protein
VGDKGLGCQVSLSCSRCQEYGNCRNQQEPAVRLSRVHPTELLRRLQDRHVDCAEAVPKKAAADASPAATVDPDVPNVLQTMMQLQQV